MTAVPAMTSCSAAPGAQQDAHKPPAPAAGSSAAEPTCGRPPGATGVAAIVPGHAHAEQCHAGSPAARGPAVGEVDELPGRADDDNPDVTSVPGKVPVSKSVSKIS